MHRIALLCCFLLLAQAAMAQPGPGAGHGPDRQAARDQLRGDLRGAAQATRPRSGATIQAVATPEQEPPIVVGYHLSPRERAEMRQQLRQEQPDVRKTRP